jgi:hypothetical protein
MAIDEMRIGALRAPERNDEIAIGTLVIDAIAHLGVRNIDMPCLPNRVWEAITLKKNVSGVPPLPGQ